MQNSNSAVEIETSQLAQVETFFPDTSADGFGKLHVIHGKRKTSDILKLLSATTHQKVAWIEPIITLNPVAVSQAGLRLSRFTFLECGNDVEWVALEVLNSSLFPIVVLAVDRQLPLSFLNQLKTSVKKSQITFIVLA